MKGAMFSKNNPANRYPGYRCNSLSNCYLKDSAFFVLYFTIDLHTAFNLVDRNRDGRVTVNELQFMLKKLGIHVKDEIINELVKEASHSGKFSILFLFYFYSIQLIIV